MRLLFLILSLLASPAFADTDDAARFKNIHNYALIADAAVVALRYGQAWPMLPMYLGPAVHTIQGRGAG